MVGQRSPENRSGGTDRRGTLSRQCAGMKHLLSDQSAVEIDPQGLLACIQQGIEQEQRNTAGMEVDDIRSAEFQAGAVAPPAFDNACRRRAMAGRRSIAGGGCGLLVVQAAKKSGGNVMNAKETNRRRADRFGLPVATRRFTSWTGARKGPPRFPSLRGCARWSSQRCWSVAFCRPQPSG
jgi:hypothetical protein